MKCDSRPGIFFLIPLVLFGIFILVAAPTARADATYTYTGKPFGGFWGATRLWSCHNEKAKTARNVFPTDSAFGGSSRGNGTGLLSS